MAGTALRPSFLLARAAHELWRERMLKEGWCPGKSFDEEHGTHDSLVPFDELPEDVQRDAEFEAIASGALDLLAQHDLHPRGDEAALLPSTAHSGQRVKFVSGPSIEGVVIGCKVDPRYGWPEFIHVRWADGDETTHPLAAGELRPIGPRSSDS
jgi:hypothetical protein